MAMSKQTNETGERLPYLADSAGVVAPDIARDTAFIVTFRARNDALS